MEQFATLAQQVGGKISGGKHDPQIVATKSVPRIVMPPLGSVARLRLRQVEGQNGRLEVVIASKEHAPQLLDLEIDATVRALHLSLPEGLRVRLRLTSATPTKVIGVAPDYLELDGSFACERLSAPHLSLSMSDGAELHIGTATWYPISLHLGGKIALDAPNLRTDQTFLRGPVELRVLSSSPFLGELGGEDGDPADLTLASWEHGVTFAWLRDGSRLRLSGGWVDLTHHPGLPNRFHFKDVTVSGLGRITIDRHVLTGVTFKSPEHSVIEVVLKSGAQILDAAGVIRLETSPRAVCIGSGDGELALIQVTGADGAEIENVDAYSLTLGDLAELARAERFTPWIPKGRKAARDLEEAARIRFDPLSEDESLTIEQRAHYWRRMESILRDSHARGAIQSRARVASGYWRAKAASGTERVLLQMYRLVRFGESIGWPLTWLVILAAIATPILVDPNPACQGIDCVAKMIEVYILALTSPLVFYRNSSLPPIVGPVETGTAILLRIVGALLIFFAANAVRRLVKAE